MHIGLLNTTGAIKISKFKIQDGILKMKNIVYLFRFPQNVE